MSQKENPAKPSGVPSNHPDNEPPADPEDPIVPGEEEDIIGDEELFESPPAFEVPEPGEGP